MVHQYNLYNLEAPFKLFLLAGNTKPVSIKNYLSDFRHFAGWLTSRKAESNSSNFDIQIADIEGYKAYLVDSSVPLKTINRRLSTIRKFCTFCISQGWLKENVAKKVTNITLTAGESKDLHCILTQFHEDSPIIDLADIKEFFTIINS